jgi:hypothetical protein
MKNKDKAEEKRFVYIAVGVAALGGLLFGYDTGVRYLGGYTVH